MQVGIGDVLVADSRTQSIFKLVGQRQVLDELKDAAEISAVSPLVAAGTP